MCKRLIFLTSLVLLLGLVGNASAATCWFYGGGSTSGDWDVSGNWWGGVPTSADTANLNEGGVTCIVDSSQTAVCNRLTLPDWQNGTSACVLSMTGGTITIGSSGNFEMGRWWGGGAPNDIGVLNLSGGTITVGGELDVGGCDNNAGAGGNGTINMTGGTIDVAGALQVPKSKATGTVNLDGGTIEAASISMDANGTMDIEDGTLIIDGNVLSTINSYVSSGYITAYNGNGTVNRDYNVTNSGQTTVTATAPTPSKASGPSPANTATDVNLDTNLSWTAGSKTSSHDVYLGTSSSAVTNATTSSGEFKGNQSSTTYDPPSNLNVSTTYYWRIDEVNDTYSTTTKGDTWSFTTASAVKFVAAGAVASGTGAITPALPSGIATNDILLLSLETGNEAISISNQNGGTWTEVTNSPQGTGGTRLTVFWSRYNGTQGNPTTSDSGNHQLGRITAFRGAAASGNPWNVTAGGVESTSDTSGAIPGTTTTVGNTLVVAIIATDLPDATGTANFSSWANGDLTAVTERTDNTVTAGNGGGLGIATGLKATAGAYGNTTVTLANSAVKGMMSIALKPEVSTPGQATSPSPADTATNVVISTNLSWTAGPNTSTHNVYLGTSSSDVNNATTSSSAFKGNQSSTTYDPPSNFNVSTTYYWRIDEVNDAYSVTTKGNIWSFTTVTSVGQQVWFNPTGSTGRWDDGDDWTPNEPNSLDTANINRAGKTCIIDSNNTGANAAVCTALWLPDWEEDGPSGDCTLSVSGGSLTVSENFEMGHWGSQGDSGLLNISGGTVDIGVDLLVGAKKAGASAGGTGTINMTGGTIDIAGAFKIPSGDAGTSGTVNLDAGTIEAGSIAMDANGLLDIEAGTLIIDGDVTSTINGYVTSGYITAYNGSGTVNVDYNVTNPGQTTVTGTSTAGVTGVEISCSASGKTVTVTYDVNSSLEVTGFALDISVDGGAVITGASNFKSDYWVYPGSIDVNQTTEQIDDYGSAVCDGNLPGTLDGIGTSGMTVEMLALYVGQANAPANSGTLFQFTVDKACTVTITENFVRDGVVMRDGSEITPNLSGCTVY
jgi:hypothetical protein